MRPNRTKRIFDQHSNLAGPIQLRLRYLQTAFQGNATLLETPIDQAKCESTVTIRTEQATGPDYVCSCITQAPQDLFSLVARAQTVNTAGFVQLNPESRSSIDLLTQVWALLTLDHLALDLNKLLGWGASHLTVMPQANGWVKSLALEQLLSRWQLPTAIQKSLIEQIVLINRAISGASLTLASDGITMQYCISGLKPNLFNLGDLLHQLKNNAWPVILVAEQSDGCTIQLAGRISLRWLHKLTETAGIQAFFWLKELSSKQKLPIQKAS